MASARRTQIFMRFPGGLDRALTLSYDDGVEQDIRLMEILDKHGIKATFNLNSGSYAPEGTVYEAGTVHRRLPESAVTKIYSNPNHEVAVHALTHPHLECMSPATVAYEIIKDRENLEKQFGTIVRGMAYPYGTYNDEVVEVLRSCGIVYARTTAATKSFTIPTDWLRLPATCHHKSSELMELAERFITKKAPADPLLFYLWGHSYEFESDNNWNVIEEFAAYMGNRPNVWYATNIEIYEYIEDYKRLVFSANGSIIKNPTNRTLWFTRKNNEAISIAPGETLVIG